MPDSLPLTWPLAAGEIELRLKPNPRARRIALRIDASGDAVEIVMPRRASRVEAMRFLEANRGWVEQRLASLPPRVAYVAGASVPIFDVAYEIKSVERVRGRGAVWIEAGTLCVTGDPSFLARRVRDFLRAEAKRELSERSHVLAESIGKKVTHVTVRDTVSRWGSCARSGHLSYSWRLIFAPEAVLDYVVAHEVAHLAEMNHGPKFWALVDQLHPAVKTQRLWLNRNRARLMRIG